MSEKLQKVLARAGVGSRRQVERWIEQGRISIDGKRATLGTRVELSQKVRLDGRIVPIERASRDCRVLIYHKPEGEICTRRDSNGRPTIFDRLPRLRSGRWVAVGRLDINSAGLLLLTTDGELANRLMHPSHEIEREYAVRVLGSVDDDTLTRLKSGVRLREGPAHFDSVRPAGGSGANRWYHVTLREGRKREVRRLWQAVGARVSRLIRVRYGPVQLPRRLHAGQWKELGHRATAELLAAAGIGEGVAVQRRSARRR
jgi:23S rRNA pseudouridine2605 synthase